MSKNFHKILQFHITFNQHNTSLYFNNFRLYPSNGRHLDPFCYTTIHRDLSSRIILQKNSGFSHSSSWPLVGAVAAADLGRPALLLRDTNMLDSSLIPALLLRDTNMLDRNLFPAPLLRDTNMIDSNLFPALC
jgi:hypothetical protein